VRPGLYALGSPGRQAPVFASANYKLSFDALREALAGFDAYVLVLDTKGINVWCAAGKGNFGTEELVKRIENTGLADVVDSRRVIVPQLCATGVAAYEVRRRTGFKVLFGPVMASDISEFMRAGKATGEMREVRFDLADRLVLIPVEARNAAVVGAASLAALLSGDRTGAAGIAGASAAGLAGFPVLMPWLPGHDFSTKGFALGGAVGLAAAISALRASDGSGAGLRLMRAASYLLALPAVTSFLALNFTGCTTFASPSGVRREMDTYIPMMAVMASGGLLLNLAQRLLRMRRR
jgi:hypothetical protein